MEEKIFVIGHKSPDLDSVAAAISYAKLKNQLEKTDRYAPAIAGETNKETDFALEKFWQNKPDILESAKGKKLILVDHNEASQSVNGREEAEIVEVLDHHKVDFSYGEPIRFTVEPIGSSCSMIYKLYTKNQVEIDKNLAGLMLSAVLVDTVITKSPTCTEEDKRIIDGLSRIAGIGDWQSFGMEVFKVRSSVAQLSAADIIKSDYKDFVFKQGKFGIGQVETADLNEIRPREEELLKELEDIRVKEGYHSVVLFITDIIKEGSQFLVASSDMGAVEKALGAKIEDGRVFIDGIISRKKQVAPKFSERFDADK